jgi:hypothetical protein
MTEEGSTSICRYKKCEKNKYEANSQQQHQCRHHIEAAFA